MSDKNVKRKAKDKFKNVKPRPLRKQSPAKWQEQTPNKEPLFTLREMRVQEAMSIIANYEYSSARVLICSQRWGVTKRQAAKYFAMANRRISEAWKGNEEQFKNKFLQELDNIKKRAKQSENIQAEIQAINSQVKLMGLEVTKSQMTIESKETLVSTLLSTIQKKNNEVKQDTDSSQPNSE